MSILKPLCGDEPLLFENLESFCNQRYPHFQVIFGTLSPHDPALDVARQVAAQFPNIDIRVVAGNGATALGNPKIATLQLLLPHAHHDLLVIADSDMRVEPGYFESIAAALDDPQTAAATCLYGARPHGGFAARLGSLHVNDGFAPSVLVALLLEKLRYCLGATMAIRRTVFDEIGGFDALAGTIADDYALGELVSKAGYRVALCSTLPHTLTTEASIGELWDREVRWARTIRSVRPAGYAGSVLTYGLALSALYALLDRRFSGGMLFGVAAALRVALHLQAARTLRTQNAPWLIPGRELLSIAVWMSGLAGNRVKWRGVERRTKPCTSP